MKQTNSTFTYQSQPRAVAPQRRKFRDERAGGAVPLYGNIMHDPRVIRGNTYRQDKYPSTAAPNPIEIQKKQEAARRKQARKRQEDKMRPKSPDPVAGRNHIEVQTELYLEELSDRVEESELATQTDPFLDRPPSPLYIPAKTGIDAETQIEDGELFDFDLESQPILEVLVGKTIEQSLMEVMEEEELDRLRDHQREFEELRTAELIETQRLEEQARRRREEKERRLKQQAEVARKERATADKIAARALAQSYLSGLVPSVYGVLDDGGYFYDQQEREVESVMMPWLMDGVELELNKEATARGLLDLLIAEVVLARAAAYSAFNPVEAIEATEAEATEAGEVVVTVPGEDAGEGEAAGEDDKAAEPAAEAAAEAPAEPAAEAAAEAPAEPAADAGAEAPAEPAVEAAADAPAEPAADAGADAPAEPTAEAAAATQDDPTTPPADTTAETAAEPAAEAEAATQDAPTPQAETTAEAPAEPPAAE